MSLFPRFVRNGGNTSLISFPEIILLLPTVSVIDNPNAQTPKEIEGGREGTREREREREKEREGEGRKVGLTNPILKLFDCLRLTKRIPNFFPIFGRGVATLPPHLSLSLALSQFQSFPRTGKSRPPSLAPPKIQA